MNIVFKIVIVLVILSSCRSSAEYYNSKLQGIDLLKFNNFSAQHRGMYLLVESKYNDYGISCRYYLKDKTYVFPKKIDSLIQSGSIDSLSLITTLNYSINDYLNLHAVRIYGTSAIVQVYFTKRDLFVRFDQRYDSLSISNYFNEEKYIQMDSVYYCKPKNHLSLY